MKNDRLINARKESGLTQEQLALMLGYKGRQAVANWENGHATPPLSIAMKISDVLNKDVEYLFCLKVQNSHTRPA